MKTVEPHEHPLAYLLHANRWSATDYLARLDPIHQKFGYGKLDTTARKRVSRWIREGVTPDDEMQHVMAVFHGIAPHQITARPWPQWLTAACLRENRLLDTEWTDRKTIELHDLIAGYGETMERRGFLVITGAGISTVLAAGAAAQPAPARARGTRISGATADLFEESLAILRRQDDQLGSGEVHASARVQHRMITTTLKNASCTEEIRRRLYAAAAEASRICAWTAYDSGDLGLAEEHYVAAFQAAVFCGDPVVTANTLNFWAIMQYSNGDPHGAADLVTDALSRSRQIGSPRMEAMLYARLARAHARAGDRRATARAENAAFAAYDRARDSSPDEDPDCVYWVNLGELHSWAATNAMDLNAPDQALTHFEAIPAAHRDEGYDTQAYPRAAALRMTRTAEAYVALGDLEGAIHSAYQAVDHIGGVTSARGTTTLRNLRSNLTNHRHVPVVSEFLANTA
nr:transcriptional regulator [Streptomyces sp. NBC_00899]